MTEERWYGEEFPNGDAETQRAIKGLPEAEAEYYILIDRWAHSDFEDTPFSLLEDLIRMSASLRPSKVKFPQNDERLINTLIDNMYGHKPVTFGNVARHMKAFFMIDVEEGHYTNGTKDYQIDWRKF